jgi:hypothetical protein
MNFNERPQFIEELQKMARQVSQKINEEKDSDILLINGYWENLNEFPLDIIKKAIQNAIRSRDNDPAYYFRAMITVPEIRVEARRLLESSHIRLKSGCEKCSGSTWIMEKVKGKSPMSHRCECWLEVQRVLRGIKKKKSKEK